MSPAEPKPPSWPASKGWYDTLVSGVGALDALPTGLDKLTTTPGHRWIGWRLRGLVLTALVVCVLVVGLVRALAYSPWVDAQWSVDAKGQVVLQASRRAELQPFVGQTLVALRAVDGFILPHGFVHDVPHLDAYTDRWVILADAENPRVGDRLAFADLQSLDWVLAFHRQGSHVPPVRQMQLLGIDLRVAVAIEGFIALPGYVAGTERVTIIQERLAREIAPAPAFRLIECPFEAVPLTEALWWHPAVEHDPGHAWFRGVVRRAGDRITGTG